MINILIADDDFNTRNGLSDTISRGIPEANIVCVCKNGAEALEFLKEHHVDLVISDVKMPEINGIQMSKIINEEYPDVKIILISAYAEFEYAQEAMQYGVRNYILKPMTHEKIQQIFRYIGEIIGETENKNSFRSLVHDPSFRNIVKKALMSRDKDSLESVTEIADNKKIDPLDFYMYIIGIIKEFLHEKNAAHLLDGDELSHIEQRKSPEEYKEFILKLFDSFQLYFYRIEKKNDGNDGKIVEYIKDYIEKNFTSPMLSTCEIAALLKMSEAHLCRSFKRSENVTLMEYITNRRMEEAKILLSDPKLFIKEVSIRCGYENEKYFYSLFKKQVGVSPTQYRQQLEGVEL